MNRILFIFVLTASTCFGGLTHDFRLDLDAPAAERGNIVGDTFTLTAMQLMEAGITFDATLTITGSSDLGHNNSGLGVDGNTINDGESVRFTLSVSDPGIVFDGFTLLDFNSFTAPDRGILSEDAAIGGGDDTILNVPLGDFSIPGSPTAFSIFGTAGNTTTSFQLNRVSASFSAVPEPSSLMLMSLIGLGAVGSRRRSRSRR